VFEAQRKPTDMKRKGKERKICLWRRGDENGKKAGYTKAICDNRS
jgi:hypothetical protein